MCPEHPSLALVDGDSEQFLPLKSVLCRWNVPIARKESNLRISVAVFEMHDYQKPIEKRRKYLIPGLKTIEGMPTSCLQPTWRMLEGSHQASFYFLMKDIHNQASSMLTPAYHLHLTYKKNSWRACECHHLSCSMLNYQPQNSAIHMSGIQCKGTI